MKLTDDLPRLKSLLAACRTSSGPQHENTMHDLLAYMTPYVRDMAVNLVRKFTYFESPHHTGEDLVSETLLRYRDNFHRLHDDPDQIIGWLYTVMKNMLLDSERKRVRRPNLVLSDGFWDTRRSSADRRDAHRLVEVRSDLLRAMRQLSAEHREALIATYFMELTIPEAAAQLGINEGTVKSRTHYAIRRLRDILTSQEEDLALAA